MELKPIYEVEYIASNGNKFIFICHKNGDYKKKKAMGFDATEYLWRAKGQSEEGRRYNGHDYGRLVDAIEKLEIAVKNLDC